MIVDAKKELLNSQLVEGIEGYSSNEYQEKLVHSVCVLNFEWCIQTAFMQVFVIDRVINRTIQDYDFCQSLFPVLPPAFYSSATGCLINKLVVQMNEPEAYSGWMTLEK